MSILWGFVISLNVGGNKGELLLNAIKSLHNSVRNNDELRLAEVTCPGIRRNWEILVFSTGIKWIKWSLRKQKNKKRNQPRRPASYLSLTTREGDFLTLCSPSGKEIKRVWRREEKLMTCSVHAVSLVLTGCQSSLGSSLVFSRHLLS